MGTLPNRLSKNVSPGTVNVGDSSTEVLASNTSRSYAILVNNSDEDMWLSLGTPAEVNKGILVNSGGGQFEINPLNLFVGAVNAIHDGTGNKVMSFVELEQ